eukprot:CAMPEP_0177648046 /NCGR_PEP_ID=MMETSP0447-20121125/10621_1 /TAXON_ID=0 /ORGANISM="Stygamoeba regulata, Strain BSH-02190019" /LENGTH=103 /DNA_ID=CAMNT_0019150665 /DNA_START=42 /DNA_END=353 /DNA_ORIENTATION=+
MSSDPTSASKGKKKKKGQDEPEVPPSPLDAYDPDKVKKLNVQVDEVKGVLADNIDKAQARGDNIAAMSQKANQLDNDSKVFYREAKRLKCKACCRSCFCCPCC